MFSSWIFWALLSAFFAACTAVFAKIGVSQLDANLAACIRTLVVMAILVGIVCATNAWQTMRSLTPFSYLALVVSGIGTGLSWLCYFRALKLGDVSRVAPIDKLSVVFVAILSTAVLGERLTLQSWLGIALITCGAALVAFQR